MQRVFIVTANRTADGRAVYLAADRTFSECLDDAHWAPDEAGQEPQLLWARAQEFDVCDPYVMSVRRSREGLAPTSAREHIRAAGPRWIAERFGYAI
ncbi:MAG: hypothetical protein DRJ42_14950 [Deltaproteobacteria bacterium]|nr:MAG: hypothetical protein DRJ42_14950 [Deltaproteobacteria bacterium]